MDGNFLASLLHSLGPGIDPTMLPEGVAPPQAPQASPLNDARRLLGLPMPQNNIMQAAAAPPDMPQPAPVPAVPEAPKIATPAEPRSRRSLLDTVGRISDVLARVGGAEALYQPTLDARDDRKQAQGDHIRQVDMQGLQRTLAEQQIGQGEDEATTRHNALVGTAVRGLQAIQRRGGDINTAWPLLARQAGIPDDQAGRLAQIFATHPEAVDGIASITGGHQEYNGQVIYARGADGHIAAFQPSNNNNSEARSILPEGYEAIDPLTFVNTGGAQVGVGQRSGTVQRILPNTERPGSAEDRAQRGEIAARTDRTQRYIADTRPGRAQTGVPNPAMVETARGNLNELRTIYGNLNRMGAMVSPSRSTGGNIVARLRASAVGQTAEGAVGTEAQTLRDRIASIRPGLMQSIARATGMTARQLDSNADVRLFMQTVTNPASSYEANLAAIAGLERFLAAGTHHSAAPAGGGGNSRPAPTRRVIPRSPAAPAGGGWGRATVVGR